jgi:hypothetical protein
LGLVLPSQTQAFLLKKLISFAAGLFKIFPVGASVSKPAKLKSGAPFAFAGLWKKSYDEGVNCCSLLTCGPNSLVGENAPDLADEAF